MTSLISDCNAFNKIIYGKKEEEIINIFVHLCLSSNAIGKIFDILSMVCFFTRFASNNLNFELRISIFCLKVVEFDGQRATVFLYSFLFVLLDTISHHDFTILGKMFFVRNNSIESGMVFVTLFILFGGRNKLRPLFCFR